MVRCSLLLRLRDEGWHRIRLQNLLQIGASRPYSNLCVLVGQPRLIDSRSEIAPGELGLIILDEYWIAALLNQRVLHLAITGLLCGYAEFAVAWKVVISRLLRERAARALGCLLVGVRGFVFWLPRGVLVILAGRIHLCWPPLSGVAVSPFELLLALFEDSFPFF